MGGSDTAAGIDFQARVAAWYAVHCLCRMPVKEKMDASFPPVSVKKLKAETEDSLDDLDIILGNGGQISIQAKMNLSLSEVEDSELAKTLGQLVRWYVKMKNEKHYIDNPVQFRAILAVKQKAPYTLDALEKFCRYYDGCATWDEGLGLCHNIDEKKASTIFKSHISSHWNAHSPVDALSDTHLVNMAKLFKIARFDFDDNGTDWMNAANWLSQQLYQDPEVGLNALATLLSLTRSQIKDRLIIDSDWLLQRLRAAGHIDKLAPKYDDDIKTLRDHTSTELEKLKLHTSLPFGAGVSLPRTFSSRLKEASERDSFFLVGEPGAGKTGALVNLAEQCLKEDRPTIFISADSMTGVTSKIDIEKELRLDNPLKDILSNWPGNQDGLFIIDALDVIRGKNSDAAFRSLISDILQSVKTTGRWKLVISIRIFDLTHSHKLQELLPGSGPEPEFVSNPQINANHFYISELTDDEFDGLEQGSELKLLLEKAPLKSKDLRRNIFNLSLVAELVADQQINAADFNISSQGALLRRYTDNRVKDPQVLRAIIIHCVDRNSFSIDHSKLKKDQATQNEINEALASGVITQNVSKTKINFTHHILFDYFAARFYLEWSDPQKLIEQLTKTETSFMLTPALGHAMELIWLDEDLGTKRAWFLLFDLYSRADINSLFRSAATRAVVELISSRDAIETLKSAILETRGASPSENIFSAIQTVSLYFKKDYSTDLSAEVIDAWEAMALFAVDDEELWPCSVSLLETLAPEHLHEKTITSITFNHAARELLTKSRKTPTNGTVKRVAINCLVKSFTASPSESAMLLEELFDEDNFEKHVHEEAFELVMALPCLAQNDPELAVRIVRKLFEKTITDDSQTDIMHSAILGMMSTKKQDFMGALYELTNTIPKIMHQSVSLGFKIVNAALTGIAYREYDPPIVLSAQHGKENITIIVDEALPTDWRNKDQGFHKVIVDFLRQADPNELHEARNALSMEPSVSSLWVILLGVLAERKEPCQLWEMATHESILDNPAILRDAIAYIAATYSTRSPEEKQIFENMLLTWERDDPKIGQCCLGRFLSIVEPNDLASPEMLKVQLERKKAGSLHGNNPACTHTFIHRPYNYIKAIDKLLTSKMVTHKSTIDLDLLAICSQIYRHSDMRCTSNHPISVSELWCLLLATQDKIHLHKVDAHPALLHFARGCLSHGVMKLTTMAVKEDALSEDVAFSDLVSLLDGLAKDPYPQTEDGKLSDDWEDFWDVRVCVAISVTKLLELFPDNDFLMQLGLRLLRDDVPSVRRQSTWIFRTLWEANQAQFWLEVNYISKHEIDPAILGGLLHPFPALVDTQNRDIFSKYLDKIYLRYAEVSSLHTGRNHDFLIESIARFSAGLWFYFGDNLSRDRLGSWACNFDTETQVMSYVLTFLRKILFAKFSPGSLDDCCALHTERAWDFISSLLPSCLVAVQQYRNECDSSQGSPLEDEIDPLKNKAHAAMRTIHTISNKLLFGYQDMAKRWAEAPPDTSKNIESVGREILQQYNAIIERIAESEDAATIYNLLKFYRLVLPADPKNVFNCVAAIIIGPAKEAGYQRESLGADVMIDFTRTCLADYRDIFYDPQCRRNLTEMLDLFAECGSTEAIDLLFELPDMFR